MVAKGKFETKVLPTSLYRVFYNFRKEKYGTTPDSRMDDRDKEEVPGEDSHVCVVPSVQEHNTGTQSALDTSTQNPRIQAGQDGGVNL